MSGQRDRRWPGWGCRRRRAKDFKGSLRRLVDRLLRQRSSVWGIVAFGVVATTLAVIGPKVLGNATDIVFTGYLNGQFPDGPTKAEVVAQLRNEGNDKLASLVSSVDLAARCRHRLPQPRVGPLGRAGPLRPRVAAAVVPGRVHHDGRAEDRRRPARRRRGQDRPAPLSYFDRTDRGEVLSRTTNDIDNIAQSFQQTMSQLLTSILMVIGTLVMMSVISPLLSLVALLTLPLAFADHQGRHEAVEPEFMKQWASTGRLNGHIEEVFTGHEVVKVFGRQQEAARGVRHPQRGGVRASFKAQFISGVIQPVMMFVSNINYVLVAVIGGLRVASGR